MAEQLFNKLSMPEQFKVAQYVKDHHPRWVTGSFTRDAAAEECTEKLGFSVTSINLATVISSLEMEVNFAYKKRVYKKRCQEIDSKTDARIEAIEKSVQRILETLLGLTGRAKATDNALKNLCDKVGEQYDPAPAK